MRLLFLSSDFVLPPDRGLRVRTLSQLRVLSGIDAVERITLLSLTDSPVSTALVRSIERQLPKVRAERPIVQQARLRGHPLAFLRFLWLRLRRDEPYLIAKFDSEEMHVLVRRHLREGNYDLVYLGYIGMVAYMSDVRELAPRAGIILEQHNVEWQIFERLAASMRPPLREAVRREAYALRRYEQRSLRRADSVVAISEADADGLRGLAGVDAVVVRPFVESNGPRVENEQRPSLGYIGHLRWQPNVFGLDWFCREVWPLVRERLPEATLTIAGTGLARKPDGALDVPPGWVKPGIVTVGFVDDLEEVYRSTLAMVAPVIGGSGVRMKLLETMSVGMPTVTTGDGAAGLGVSHDREVLIADSPSDFADCVVRLLADAALRERLRRGGYEFIASRHSEPIAAATLERSLAAARDRVQRARGAVRLGGPREGGRHSAIRRGAATARRWLGGVSARPARPATWGAHEDSKTTSLPD
jgi:glycosyltransferase involved in cell wall biosynthesis